MGNFSCFCTLTLTIRFISWTCDFIKEILDIDFHTWKHLNSVCQQQCKANLSLQVTQPNTNPNRTDWGRHTHTHTHTHKTVLNEYTSGDREVRFHCSFLTGCIIINIWFTNTVAYEPLICKWRAHKIERIASFTITPPLTYITSRCPFDKDHASQWVILSVSICTLKQTTVILQHSLAIITG